MKRLVTQCAVFGAGLLWTSLALAVESPFVVSPDPPAPPVHGSLAAYFQDPSKVEEAPAMKVAPAAPAQPAPPADSGSAAEPSCSTEPLCGAESSCGDDVKCGDACGSNGIFCDDWCKLCIDDCWPFCCCCDYGDPCTLQKHLTPCCDKVTYGGWLAFGYYTDNDPLSVADNDLLSFWDNPGELGMDQAWFYVEKLAKGDCCCWDCGYRFDLLYGVDAQKMQAFGNSGYPDAQGYDNPWDHGNYGWALPQAYLQFNNGDLDIKVGHFFTLVGYEVLNAPGNFFYSHNYTMFNSEPFTHTGALATYKVNDKLSVMAGWVLGWDTGFDQYGDGNAIHSGFTYQACDDVKFSYMMTGGDLGWRGDGYSHSNVLDVKLSSKWQYVFQTDLLTTETNNALNDGLSYGVVNYLFYTINDCWKWGTRAEWWKSNQSTTDIISYYEVTTGFNYKASANLIVRPEVKFNWCPAEDNFEAQTGGDFNETLFGIDAIYTF